MRAKTDEQKQEMLRKRRRETRADALLRLPMEEMRTCQREHLVAETTADKRTRLQQILKCPSAQTERLPPESATERDIRLQQMSTRPCERLAAETPGLPLKEILQRMNDKQTAEKELPGLNVTEQDMGNKRLFSNCCLFFSSVPSKPRCKNPMQAWLHWIYQCYASLTLPCGLADKGNGR